MCIFFVYVIMGNTFRSSFVRLGEIHGNHFEKNNTPYLSLTAVDNKLHDIDTEFQLLWHVAILI